MPFYKAILEGGLEFDILADTFNDALEKTSDFRFYPIKDIGDGIRQGPSLTLTKEPIDG